MLPRHAPVPNPVNNASPRHNNLHSTVITRAHWGRRRKKTAANPGDRARGWRAAADTRRGEGEGGREAEHHFLLCVQIIFGEGGYAFWSTMLLWLRSKLLLALRGKQRQGAKPTGTHTGINTLQLEVTCTTRVAAIHRFQDILWYENWQLFNCAHLLFYSVEFD